MKGKFFQEKKSKKTMHKSKGKWVVASLLLAGSLGAVSLSNEEVRANVNTLASQGIKNFSSSDFVGKDQLSENGQIKQASQDALKRIKGTWTKNSVDQVKGEIARQQAAGYQAYVVQWGDTLSVLAEATGQDLNSLAQANHLGNIHLIFTGDLLTGVLSPLSQNNDGTQSAKTVSPATTTSETSAQKAPASGQHQDQASADLSPAATEAAIEKDLAENVKITVLTPQGQAQAGVNSAQSNPQTESSESGLSGHIVENPASIDTALPEENAGKENQQTTEAKAEPEQNKTESVENPTVIDEKLEDADTNKDSEAQETKNKDQAPTEKLVKEKEVQAEANPKADNKEKDKAESSQPAPEETAKDKSETSQPAPEKTPEDKTNKEQEKPADEITSVSVQKTFIIQPGVRFVADDQLALGQEKTVQEGKEGKRVVETTVQSQAGKEIHRSEKTIEYVPAEDKVVHVGTKALSTKKILTQKVSIPFQTKYTDNNDYKAGSQKVLQKGENGEKTVTYEVTYQDGKEVSRQQIDEKVTKEPVDQIVQRGTKTPGPNQHIVSHGESLWSIAKRYGVTVDGIRKASGLSSNTLYTNQVLTIPKDQVGTVTTSLVYTVGPNETVNSIASAFGISPQALRSANGLTGNYLADGQELQIPNAPVRPMNIPQASDGIRTVMLDPGHGNWSGASYAGANEGTLNKNLADKLTRVLQSRGYRVLSARPGTSDTGLLQRSQIANESNADIFVSMHHNAMGAANRGKAQGIETYYYQYFNNYPSKINPYHNNAQRITNSAYLAKQIQNQLIGNTGAINRGVQTNTFAVLRETDIPAVLIEYGFGDNPQELSRLRNSNYQDKLVQATANAIDAYFNNVY
ncbi:N-acetylmuramoyl-L-alanine amidase [Aerococcus sp. Group 1]|uniref:N-acetylmuramoyl-L-alanine amidase n=1 Tax=Aerococcus urinae (strain CCUG 59500 / ACS-120-V-Col10a) TaxID=2976812 RepID=UPI00227BEFB1|nr:N-acetylmuramoyl-L-alanine amidase [Aerococcus sp. Group 1]MCY3030394.1 N-acetylmuramoyl-L-alanine amidase [Aerococcus sp. Group 1]